MFRRILVPLDGSDLAEEAIGMAAAIARRSKATIDLVMVHEPLYPALNDSSWTEREIVAGRRYLERVAAELTSGAGVDSSQTLLRGKPPELIITRAVDCAADLIVMTSHGRTGWSRAWIGSVADAVMRGSNVPILMLRPAERSRSRRALREAVRRILIPLDGSSVAMEIATPAVWLAQSWNARVDVLRVVEPVPLMVADLSLPYVYAPNLVDGEATEAVVTEARETLERDARMLEREGVTVAGRTVVVSTQPAAVISDHAAAHDVDLIAMSTHGRGMSRLFVGSVADKVRRSSGLPMLLVRPRFARVPQAAMTSESIAEQLPSLAAD